MNGPHDLGGQHGFGPVAADTWPTHRHLPAPEDDLAGHRAGARGLTLRLMRVPQTADRGAIVLEHRRQHLQARCDREFHQLCSRIHEQIDERQMALSG